MDPREDPFVPGAGVAPPVLLGREEVVERFSVALDKLQSGRFDVAPLITGSRGSGKTVLVNELVVQAREKGWFAAFDEVSPRTPLSELIVLMAHDMLIDMSAKKRAAARVRRALGVLKAFTAVSAFGLKLSIDVDAVSGTADSGLFDRDLRNLLVELGETARDQSVGILFALDEVHTLSHEEMDSLHAALHRTAQLQLPVAFLAAGLFPSWQSGKECSDPSRVSSYVGRMTVSNYVRLEPLSPRVARDVLAVPLAGKEVVVEDAALGAAVDFCEGNPWLLQLVGSAIWEVADASPIELAKVGEALKLVETRLEASFLPRLLRTCTDEEMRILMAMAEDDSVSLSSGQLYERLSAKPVPDRDSVVESVGDLARRDLISLDYLINLYGDFSLSFSVPRLGSYLRGRAVGGRK